MKLIVVGKSPSSGRDTASPLFLVGPSVAVSGTDVTITATTSENTDFAVEFWITADGYPTRISVWWDLDSETVHSHVLTAAHGVVAGGDYSYQVVVRDAAGNVTTSEVGTFTAGDLIFMGDGASYILMGDGTSKILMGY